MLYVFLHIKIIGIVVRQEDLCPLYIHFYANGFIAQPRPYLDLRFLKSVWNRKDVFTWKKTRVFSPRTPLEYNRFLHVYLVPEFPPSVTFLSKMIDYMRNLCHSYREMSKSISVGTDVNYYPTDIYTIEDLTMRLWTLCKTILLPRHPVSKSLKWYGSLEDL